MGFFADQWNHIRGNVKWDAIKYSAALVITATGYLLHKIGHLPDWTMATGLFLSSLVVFAISTKTRRSTTAEQSVQQPSATQVVVQAVGLEQTIGQFEEVYRTNTGQMLQESEAMFRRLAAHFPNPAERENFLMRVLAGGSVVVLHHEVWWVIWRSQIELLQELNTHPLSLQEAKHYYDAAAGANPPLYKNYSFEQWLNYLRSHNLVLQTNVMNITVRGRDFLRFMVQQGWSAKNRFN